MTTMTKDEIPKKVTVHTYLSSQKRYLVSYADEEDAAAVAAIMPQLNAMAIAASNSQDEDDEFFDADDEFFDAEEDKNNDTNQETKQNSQQQQPPPTPPVVLLSYTADQLEATKAAKFYPLLLELMKRGDQAAHQVGALYQQNKEQIHAGLQTLQSTTEQVTQKLTLTTQQLVESEDNKKFLEQGTTKVEAVAEDAVAQLKSRVTQHQPAVNKEVQKVIAMLKDEEFTTLLQNGKERLEQLVRSDISQQARTTLASLGIQWNSDKGGMIATATAGTTETPSDVDSTTSSTKSGNKALEESQQKALAAVDDVLQIIKQAAKAQGIELPQGGDNNNNDVLALLQGGLNMQQLQEQLNELHLDDKFKVMFDQFVEASKSDRHLSGIMEHVAQHTTEWQQMTGRLLATKSGSLFLEGASRIQARAGLILSGGLNNGSGAGKPIDLQEWTQSMTTKFTKAFTEGDAAVARLKSIELGDAVRQRLVAAIEIRSDSLGGLDGIIARALGAVETHTKQTTKALKKHVNHDVISTMLADLQKSATGKHKEAHETLISVLSRGSLYRDIVLLKLERTFCDLEEQFFGATWNSEDSWSAEQLAKLARGEGGTAELFEPIAKRAKLEIDKQLDHAEHLVREQREARGGTDPNADMILEALSRVRKIMSGELTMNAIVEDVVTLLNDDKIVSAGEDLIQRGERVLDAIENAQNNLSNTGDLNDPTNKVIGDAMRLAQKAGITKDSVMKELEKINVDEVLDTAQGAMTDETKRLLLLSQATDAALDFFLKVLPSMPVPPFEGVKDGLVYHLSNLSMEGFKVKKENIVIEIAGMRATTDPNKKVLDGGMGMKAMKAAIKDIPPSATAGTPLEGPDSNSSLVEDDSDNDTFSSPPEELEISTTAEIGHVKATELLIIDISEVAANLDGANWSFEQTYFPYLKGKGASDVALANGCVRLQFELRKRKRKIQVAKVGASSDSADADGDKKEETEEKEIWEPVLCLHDRSCKIGEVFVSLQGEGKLAWILNKLSGIFKGPIGSYVARQIVAVMSNRSGVILDKLNTVLSPYWDLILSTAGLKMVRSWVRCIPIVFLHTLYGHQSIFRFWCLFGQDELEEADHRHITTADSEDKENTIELVWRERLPLGLNLLLNDESGQVKVVDLPRGSQARKVCEARNLNPDMFNGATIVAVNGCRFFEPEEVYDALRDPIRPKTILFELAESAEAARVHEFVADAMSEKERKVKETATGGTPQKGQDGEAFDDDSAPAERTLQTRTLDLTEPGDLGIEFGEAPDSIGLVVCGFVKKEDGTSLAAEESGIIRVHDLLTHINGKVVLGENGAGRDKAFEVLQSEGAARPLSLSFCNPYMVQQVFEAPKQTNNTTPYLGGPMELCLEESVTKNEDTGTSTKRIVLADYKDTDGLAETRGILIGDYLVFVNGKSIGAGARWMGEGTAPTLEEVYKILRDPTEYPMGLTFARPKNSEGDDMNNSWKGARKGNAGELDDADAETVAVSTERLELLGCVFDIAENTASDVIVSDFYAVPGFFQTSLVPLTGKRGKRMIKLAIESINGQFVPSYASKDIVMSAIRRSWRNEQRVELTFCDDELKGLVHSLVSPASTTTAE